MAEPLVLASRSPQRRAILEQLGVEFVARPSDAEERVVDGDARATVVENARRKARAVDGALVLGCDTEVLLEGRVFGKAEGRTEAEEFLRLLSGRTHEVWGGLVLRGHDGESTAAACTRVRFRDLDERWIGWYLDSGEWRDRAGAYAIQGIGSVLVEAVEGDFWNVVGLPVAELVRLAPALFLD